MNSEQRRLVFIAISVISILYLIPDAHLRLVKSRADRLLNDHIECIRESHLMGANTADVIAYLDKKGIGHSGYVSNTYNPEEARTIYAQTDDIGTTFTLSTGPNSVNIALIFRFDTDNRLVAYHAFIRTHGL